ncbi:hypothetical protein RM780_16015 [Streptomyces sp. DSM 44917]|uniref:Uncharacterized protein n=1 Tax=Streptomyces boetiae TaxID=3075541 RepID=A0ABU2LAE1_9ACTN|nr:hypothetical protein [Streptomyces sp. DSM 44917]MDT0308456.1 hypothetical protein [Streptomyces sp. DSM 44917]
MSRAGTGPAEVPVRAVPGLTLALIGDEALRADGHPELCVRLVIEGIVHDPAGREPPERLEVRMSPRALRELIAQGRAAQRAQVVQARARAERDAALERSRAATAATDATDDARVDTGVLERVVMGLHRHRWPPGPPGQPAATTDDL